MKTLKFIIRNLAKSKMITSINLTSLAVGLGAVGLIAIYVIHEVNYDKFHDDQGNIYRVAINEYRENQFERESYVYTSPLAQAMYQDLPGIESYVRISIPNTDYFYVQNEPFKIEDYIYTDSTFFTFFSFELLTGDPKEVLAAPFSIVLTKSVASRLFGSKNPLGELIHLNNKTPYTITGIVEDPPANSHIRFNMLVSFASRHKESGVYMGWNGGNQYTHYIKVTDNASIANLQAEFEPFMWKYLNADYAEYHLKDELVLQSFPKIHLNHNQYSSYLKRNLWIFSGIGLLLLAIALINFINLTIADSVRRVKNYSILKIVGASRTVLIKNIVTELTVLILIALGAACALILLIYPLFETLIGKEINLDIVFNWTTVGIGMLFLGLIILVACILPILFFTNLQPVHSLKKAVTPGKSRFGIRNGMVIFQFLISITLIISILTINQQNRFLLDFDTGYDKENVMVVPLSTANLQEKATLLKEELRDLPKVESISCSSEVPNSGFTSNGYLLEGSDSPEIINVVDVDEEFLNLMDVDLLLGENFSPDKSTDNDQYLVNESFIQVYGWQNPLGKTITRNGKHQIIGVVKDFNFASLHNQVKPLILTNQPWNNRYDYMMIKLAAGSLQEVIRNIESEWKEVSRNEPFEFSFLDEEFTQIYKSEASFQKLISIAAILTIIISLAGLFALSLFSIQRRIKEIGIRKVSGAKEWEIMSLLNKDFVKWVIIAYMVACPLAYLAMDRWLENFAYRISQDWKNFILAGILALIIALMTTSWQSWKAATTNPVNVLRTE